MAVSEAQKRARNKYDAANFDLVNFRVRKGKKAVYKEEAEARGLGLMAMIRIAIEEFIANHEAGTVVVSFEKPAEEEPEEELSEQEQLLLARFNRLPQKTKDTVLNLVGEAARVANKGAD